MSNVINPHIAVLIKGASDWWSDDETPRLEMSIEVTKDLDDEPNEAVVEIFNLNADTRSRIIDPSVRDTPIEIHFSAFGTEDLTKCFVGEVETARTERQWPGLVTRLVCKSQRWHTRSKYLEGQTYEAGTPIQQIIDDIVKVIDLPLQSETLPSTSVLLAQTFNGPAFFALRKFLYSYGYFVYITDGILYISGVYAPPNPTQITVTKNFMVSEPRPIERKDAIDVVLHTITDTNNVNPFAKKNRRNKKAWKKQALSRNDYVEYDAIDDVIFGVECETLGTPAVQPDNIVTFEGDSNTYRVQQVTHRGDTREGVTTWIQADLYEGEPLYGGAEGFGPMTDRQLREKYFDLTGDSSFL